MSVPSIKGTAFQSVGEDLLRLCESGQISRDELEAALEPEDLAILDENFEPTRWYPICTYARIVNLLARTESPNAIEKYLERRGERAAERLSELGIYSQLDATTENMGSRIGHLMVTVAKSIYSFTEWKYEPSESESEPGFTIHITGAADLPECSRFTTQGFIQWVASHASAQPMRVTSQRPDDDTIVYTAVAAS